MERQTGNVPHARVLLLAAILATGGSAAARGARQETLRVRTAPVSGLGPEPAGARGVLRRDPSDLLALDGRWFVFYTRLRADAPLAPEGYAGSVWYATSEDGGHSWIERGPLVEPRGHGFDATGCFTPNAVLGPSGDVYVVYTGVGAGFENRPGSFEASERTALGVVRARFAPDGALLAVERPRTARSGGDEPILVPTPAETGAFDSFRVDDAALVLRDGRVWLYYKGRAQGGSPSGTCMGLAVAERPEGPYVRVGSGPVQPEGHEVLVWEHAGGVVSLVTNAGSGVWFSDGDRFAKLDVVLEGRLFAPGLARADLVDPDADALSGGLPLWGLHTRAAGGVLFLERFELELPASLDGSRAATCTPVPNPENRSAAAGWGAHTWAEELEGIRAAAHALRPRLVLLGDSITQGWAGGGRAVGGAGAEARARWLDPLGPVLNAGLSGDRTQHVLWRLEHGMLAESTPATVALMIGTNNLPHDSAADIARGVEAIVAFLRRTLPGTQILLLGCPPRGRTPDEPLRAKGAELDGLLRRLAQGQDLSWLDVGALLLDASGTVRAGCMAADFVHLSPTGYDLLGRAIAERLAD